jgi:hypothetical protein
MIDRTVPRSRITITVRPELVEAADRKAIESDRSRSWVFERAVERYLHSGGGGGGAGRAREVGVAYVPGLGSSRQAQLEADLALTPEQRVRHAEETARVADLRGAEPQRARIILFARLEDFMTWQRREEILP